MKWTDRITWLPGKTLFTMFMIEQMNWWNLIDEIRRKLYEIIISKNI